MARLTHYSVVEINDDRKITNVGAFTNITNDYIGRDILLTALNIALSKHLDCDEDDLNYLLFTENFDEEFVVTVFGLEHTFVIGETWLYRAW